MSTWSCSACTFVNTASRAKCEICATAKPAASSASKPVLASASSFGASSSASSIPKVNWNMDDGDDASAVDDWEPAAPGAAVKPKPSAPAATTSSAAIAIPSKPAASSSAAAAPMATTPVRGPDPTLDATVEVVPLKKKASSAAAAALPLAGTAAPIASSSSAAAAAGSGIGARTDSKVDHKSNAKGGDLKTTKLERGDSTGSDGADGGWGAAEDDDDAGGGGGGWDDDVPKDDVITRREVTLLSSDVRDKIQSDIDEVNLIQRFAAKVDFMGGASVRVWLAIDPRHLKLDKEQRLAWYMAPDKHVSLELQFSPYYWEGSERPVVNVVGQSYGFATAIEKFGLSWTLHDRIKTQFMNKLPHKNVKAGFKVADVKGLMDLSGQNALVSILALCEKKNNVNEAATLLSDKKQLAALTDVKGMLATDSKDEKKSSSSSGGGGASGFFSSLFGYGSSSSSSAAASSPGSAAAPAKDSEAALVSNLVNTFGVSPSVAIMALQLEGSPDAAALLLTNSEAVAQLQSIVESSEGGSGGGGGFGAGGSKSESQLVRDRLDSTLAEHNYLVRLLMFLENKLMTCNSTCLICDTKLDFASYKPSICSKALCANAFEEYQLGFDLGKEIVANPQIVDLLISMLAASIAANRLLFVTPTNVKATDKTTGREVSFGSGENVDVSRLNACIAACPSLQEMARMVEKGILKQELNKLDPLLYSLLVWILQSNRAHIRLLAKNEQMNDLKTPHQFVLLSSTPDREKKFQALKAGASVSWFSKSKKAAAGGKKGNPVKDAQNDGKTLGGSCWAYHGSGTGNWHSILRSGLKNMSNTKYMLNGAARGSGIYMATDSGTSLGYCGAPTSAWSKSMYGNFICLAICEVVNQSHLSGNVYVVPNEDTVVTRFLIVYPSSSHAQSGGVNVAVSKLNIPHLA